MVLWRSCQRIEYQANSKKMSVARISFRKRLALNIFSRYRKNEIKIHQLNYILWECTLRCNLNCLHCGSDCKKDASTEDMPAEDFLKALDDVRAIVNPNKTMIVLTGGEVLLRKDLEQIGKELYQRGFPWGIVTNGMLLDNGLLNRLLQSGLRSVTVSLDGLEDSHNWLRGNRKSFSRAWTAVQLLSNIQDLRYDVVTCVHQKNIEELHELRTRLIDAGVKEWRIFTVFPIGRAAEYPELELTLSLFKGLFDFIKTTREESLIKLNYGCEGFLGNYEGEVRDNFFICRSGINIASILVDGSITGCPNLRENFIQGNIYSDIFRDVWEQRFEKFRDRRWTNTGLCGDCEFFKFCNGNGMHLHDEKTGELLFCHFQRIKDGERAQISG